MSRSSGNILDYYVDLKDREATLVGLRWLNSKQVKLERSIQRQAAIDFAHAHRNDTNYLLVRGPLEPLQSDKAATCFACGKHHVARRWFQMLCSFLDINDLSQAQVWEMQGSLLLR